MRNNSSNIFPKSIKEFFTINLSVKWVGLILAVLILIFINEIYARPMYPQFDRQFRCLSHLYAGILMPHFFQMFSGYTNNHSGAAKVYAVACLILELLNIPSHGYFQIDQFISDLIGVGMCSLYAHHVNKPLDLISSDYTGEKLKTGN